MPRPQGHVRPVQSGARTGLLRWLPARGLRDEDWVGRHRLLTWLLILTAPALTVFAAVQHALDVTWLVTVAEIGLTAAGALSLSPRRLPSMCVALGLTMACAGFVMMCQGRTEAHFTYFIAVGALALYRDWRRSASSWPPRSPSTPRSPR